MTATNIHLPAALQNTWITNPKIVKSLRDTNIRRSAVFDGISIEEFDSRTMYISYNNWEYAISYHSKWELAAWHLRVPTTLYDKETVVKDYQITEDSIIIGQDLKFPYTVIWQYDNNSHNVCFKMSGDWFIATKNWNDTLRLIKLNDSSFLDKFCNNPTTTEMEPQIKKYLKDKTLFNFPIAGSTEVEFTKKDGKIYILASDIKEDNRPEAEVMQELALAELAAEMDKAGAPEWAKKMYAIMKMEKS